MNVSHRSRWYFSGEVQLGFLAGALCLIGAMALVTSFARAQNALNSGPQWLPLNYSPTLAILLTAVPLGFLYGRLSRNTEVEVERSLAEAYRLLNDVSIRQIQSGNAAQVDLITSLAFETERAKQTAAFILDKIWQIHSHLNSVQLQRQLAAAIGTRHLRAWLRNDEQQPTVGNKTIIEFQIQPFEELDVSRTTTFKEQDAEGNRLLVYIVSDQIEVEGGPVPLTLPDIGFSNVARALLVPKMGGECKLTFLLMADATLELLQTYSTSITVLPATNKAQNEREQRP